ncbi:glycoside hydrolase family 15 [Georgenia sp. TF02-10]|uniref:glycoside hydrolase family 15 n=1 Tax=Georgenia sp. TF02-10 TaxID=2917725 RepID=UPI001FA7E4E4|nr:glycoside hydrolase family 15 [Georgenia sp. TF02-10]UNX53240.1 glycoside hydrolase family 15 [Georgenia sp. TF02-10]
MRPSRSHMANPDAGEPGKPETRLYSEGAFLGKRGPVLVPAGSAARRVEGTAFLDPRSAEIPGAHQPSPAEIDAFRERLAAADLHAGRWAEMARTALLDLYALRRENGAVLGAGSPYWAFVWPRDNAFVVVALSLLGLHEDAWAALDFIYSVQEEDGQWEARYLPDGSGEVPDERGRQDDGIGYTLWATWVASRLSPAAVAERRLAAVRPRVLLALQAAGDVLDPETRLPRPGQDFWERDEAEPPLGVAGPLLVGLRAGVELADRLGDPDAARRGQEHAAALEAAVMSAYGANGFQRFPSGGRRDASVAFLLPPFVPPGTAAAEAKAAWQASVEGMRVAAGGLRPGEGWPDTTTAWTPQTSLYAIVAAALDERELATELLDWLDAHRTRLGSLPEKVTRDGRPAAVAPISTVAAAVLIALALLDNHELPAPTGREAAAARPPSHEPTPEKEGGLA